MSTLTARRRAASLSDSGPTTLMPAPATPTPNIPTQNRYGILTHCLIEPETEEKSANDTPGNTLTHAHTPEHENTKPPPLYIHGSVDHAALLDTIKTKYNDKFTAKYTSGKLKVNFHHIKDFKDFKDICQHDNIQYHTYSIATEKVLTVVLKGLIKLPSKTIINDLKAQGLNPLTCTEIPAPTKYPIYRITFAPGATLTKINHIRFVQNLKIYWEKFDSRKPTIQCYRCQAHGHSSTNCNKKAVCVKCAGPHNTRECTKTKDVPPTCCNCRGTHPANYSKCPALIAFLAKRQNPKPQQVRRDPTPLLTPPHAFPTLPEKTRKLAHTIAPPPPYNAHAERQDTSPTSYASVASRSTLHTKAQVTPDGDPFKGLDDFPAIDLDRFLKIIALIRKHYAHCTNDFDRIQATILILKELETGP